MDNPVGLKRFGPITFFVKDAEGEATRLSKMLGMDIAYLPEGKDPIYGLEANEVLFILDGTPRSAALAERYGNHVAEIGLRVENASRALEYVRTRTSEPSRLCERTGVGYVRVPHDGDIQLRLVEDGQTPYLGMVRNPNLVRASSYPFRRIDHIVFNTQAILPCVTFLHDALGMRKVNEFTIKVHNEDFLASLYSEVMGIYGSEQAILFPLNEPLQDDNQSQIPAQLREIGRSHAQHIALMTDNIIESIAGLRSRGLGFLEFRNAQHAASYYANLPNRLGSITVREAIDTLRGLGVLIDKCGSGYLLQLFSKRMFPEKSVPFVEIIQRASDVIGCFGDGNFAALAEALEHSMREEANRPRS